jgi:hypothetical protein
MSDTTSRTVADVEAAALAKGLTVRYPEPNELFIDIDTVEQYAQHLNLLTIFTNHEEIEGTIASVSPSGKPGRFHVVVRLKRPVVDETERVMLQALLGSDTKRELLSWRRIDDGAEDKAISVFFEKPIAKESAAE